ncbi:mCG1027979, isoform CRA_b, partial [Mus musculus]
KDWWSRRSCWSRVGATIGGPYGELTPPPSSELSAVSGCRQGKFTVSETCDPRSLGRTSDKIERQV